MKCDNSDDNDRCLNNDHQLADIRRGEGGIMVERGKVGKEEGKMEGEGGERDWESVRLQRKVVAILWAI